MILLYHHVVPRYVWAGGGPPDEGWDLCHSPEGLECHLLQFLRRGYRFVSLSEMVEVIRRAGRAPDRAIALTFDDGWKDNHEYALPVLRRLGVPATFFLTTEHLRPGSRDERKMGRKQLQELVEAGMTLGGHSRTHVDLTRLPESRARDEIRGCRADLEDLTGRPVSLFAYPGGVFNRSVVEVTREAGYEAACSVLSPAPNDQSTLFWLFRDPLTERMNTLHDWYRLSPGARWLFAWRVRKRLRLMLR
jgi:peptidoglycan/xylan/chitin deacetylase (PgdA/CDA1 family)